MKGSEDALINIKGMVGYKMTSSEKEFQMIKETESKGDDNDEFEESSSL